MSSKAHNERCRLVVASLAERWPATFFPIGGLHPPRPLAIGIRDAVLAALPDMLGLRSALAYYCRQPEYRRRAIPGAIRIDLNGEPAGVVTDEQAEAAETERRADQLARKEKKRRKREHERAARPKVSAPPQSQTAPAPKVEPTAEISTRSVDVAAKQLARAWELPTSRAGVRDRQPPKFQVEVKRRRVVLSARDQWEHGR